MNSGSSGSFNIFPNIRRTSPNEDINVERSEEAEVGEEGPSIFLSEKMSTSSQTNILSFLQIGELVRMLKVNRFAYHLITNDQNRRRILTWTLHKDEELRINKYILTMLAQNNEFYPF